MALFYGCGLTVSRLQSHSRRQITFYHSVLKISWYSFNQPRDDERLSQPWNHPVVLNLGPPGMGIQHLNH